MATELTRFALEKTMDRELLELAAKALGLTAYNYESKETYSDCYGNVRAWNPPAYDEDALRLAVDLKMNIHLDDNMVDVDPDGINWLSEAYMNDPYAATRRAIVRAAAEIGRSM